MTTPPQSHLTKAETLVGRYVHTHYDKGHWFEFPDFRPICKQGLIVAQHGEYYEVQWFSFVSGEPNESTMHRLDEMVFDNWTFFIEQEDWVAKADQQHIMEMRGARATRKKKK